MDDDEPLYDAEEQFGSVEADQELVDTIRGEWGPDPDEVYAGDVYAGDMMRWVGSEGRMMQLDWDQVHAFPGNPFDPEKAAAYAELFRQGDADGDKPLVYAPPAMLSLVTLDDVRESQEAQLRGELFETHGMTRPFTTGDEELDEYLGDPEAFVETYADDDDDAEAIKSDMIVRSERAIEEQSGDLGKITAQLRDGNHRAFGAQLAGEPNLWVIVRTFNDEELQRVGLRPEDLE